jgi:hypothetical protein
MQLQHEQDAFGNVVAPVKDVFTGADARPGKDAFVDTNVDDRATRVFNEASVKNVRDQFDREIRLRPNSDPFQSRIDLSSQSLADKPGRILGYDAHSPLSSVPIDAFDVNQEQHVEDTVFGVDVEGPTVNVFVEDQHANEDVFGVERNPDVMNLFAVG